MSVMFSEELDKLRVGLHDAEQRAFLAESEKDKSAAALIEERNRAERAEALLAEQEHHVQDQRRQMQQLIVEINRIPQLQADESAARLEAQDFRAEVERLDGLLSKEKETLDALRNELSEITAERDTFRAELDPTRKVIAALCDKRRAERKIEAEAEWLDNTA